MNRRASCVRTFEVFEAAHVTLRTLLAFSQPVNCIFWPIGMLNWLVAGSKLHKHRETCCTAEWPFYSFLILRLHLSTGALAIYRDVYFVYSTFQRSISKFSWKICKLHDICINGIYFREIFIGISYTFMSMCLGCV